MQKTTTPPIELDAEDITTVEVHIEPSSPGIDRVKADLSPKVINSEKSIEGLSTKPEARRSSSVERLISSDGNVKKPPTLLDEEKEDSSKRANSEERRKGTKIRRQRSRSMCDPQQPQPAVDTPTLIREPKGKTLKKRAASSEREKSKLKDSNDKDKETKRPGPKVALNRKDVFFSGRMSMALYVTCFFFFSSALTTFRAFFFSLF